MPDQQRDDRDFESATAPLTRTSRSRAWLWPTVAVVGVLVAVVILGKSGETPAKSVPTNAARAVPSATALATRRPVGQRETLTAPRPTVAGSAPLVGNPIGLRNGSDRFDDGIPSIVNGEPVLRVREAASLPIGTTTLVAGWYRRVPCPSGEGARPCLSVLSDVPFRSPRVAIVALGGMIDFERGRGPRVFEATVAFDPACAFSALGECLPRLSVGSTKWSGDAETTTAPYEAEDLLGALASRFPVLDFQSFVEATSCPVLWPTQSYVVSSQNVPRIDWPGLDVRLVAMFPSTESREEVEPGMRAAAAAMVPFDASNRCVAIPGGVDDSAWVVRQNVMILLGPANADVRATVEGALDELPAVGVR